MSSALLDNLASRSKTLRRRRRNSELMELTVSSSCTELLRSVQRLGLLRRRAVAERNGGAVAGEEPVTQQSIDEMCTQMVMATKVLGSCVNRAADRLAATDRASLAEDLRTERLDEVARCVTGLVKLCRMTSAEKRASSLSVSVNSNVVLAVRKLLDVCVEAGVQTLSPTLPVVTTETIAEEPESESDDEDEDGVQSESSDDEEGAEEAEDDPATAEEEKGEEEPAGEDEANEIEEETAAKVEQDDAVGEADRTVGNQAEGDGAPAVKKGSFVDRFHRRGDLAGVVGRPRRDSLAQRVVRSGKKQLLKVLSIEDKRKRDELLLARHESAAEDREAYLMALVPPLPSLNLLPLSSDPAAYVRVLLLNEICQTEAVFLRDVQLMVVLYRDPAIQRGVFHRGKPSGGSDRQQKQEESGDAASVGGGGGLAPLTDKQKEKAEKIFGNLLDLVPLLYSLIGQLEMQFSTLAEAPAGGESQALSQVTTAVCHVYQKSAATLGAVFRRFCELFCSFSVRHKKLANKSPEFHALLDDPVRRRICAGQSLADLSMKPIQRLCRYALLFRGLRDSCPPESLDYTQANGVVETFDRLVNSINHQLPAKKFNTMPIGSKK